MSGLKKILLILGSIVILITGFIQYNNYQVSLKLKKSLQDQDKIESLFYLSEYSQYEKAIRAEGYKSIPNSLAQLDKSGYSLEIRGKIPFRLGYMNEQSNTIDIFLQHILMGLLPMLLIY